MCEAINLQTEKLLREPEVSALIDTFEKVADGTIGRGFFEELVRIAYARGSSDGRLTGYRAGREDAQEAWDKAIQKTTGN